LWSLTKLFHSVPLETLPSFFFHFQPVNELFIKQLPSQFLMVFFVFRVPFGAGCKGTQISILPPNFWANFFEKFLNYFLFGFLSLAFLWKRRKDTAGF